MEAKEFLEKFKNRIFSLALIILVCFIAYNSIYKKKLSEEMALKERISDEVKKGQVLVKIGDKEAVIGVYKDLLSRKDASSVINALTNIARDSDVRVISIRPNPEVKFPDYVKTPFSLEINSGSYHTLAKFISRVENYKDVYSVDSVDVRLDNTTKVLTANVIISSIAFAN